MNEETQVLRERLAALIKWASEDAMTRTKARTVADFLIDQGWDDKGR